MSDTATPTCTTDTPEPREALIRRLGDEIAEIEAHVTAALHRQLVVLREFDRMRGWADEGATSCAAWLTWRIGLSGPVARERVRIAHALADLPLLSAAHARGEVSFSQVRAMTRIVTSENEAHWLGIAHHSTAHQLEHIIQKTRRALACQQPDQHAVEQEARSLLTHIDADGMLVIRARLPPEAGAAFEKALAAFETDPWREVAHEEETRAEGETREQRRADALVAMADHVRCGGKPMSGADRNTVVVHVDAEVLSAQPCEPAEGRCELDGGQVVPAGTAQRLACDSGVVWIYHGPGGEVLDVGRKGRTVTTRLGRALHERDKGCRFPGCKNRLSDAHHVTHWAHGGRTDLENLCSLCRRHHTYVHEGRFTVEADARGGFIFKTPNGTLVTPGSVLPEIAAQRKARPDTLQALHEAMDMSFHAGTFICDWDGERPDYAYIAEVMSQFSRSSTIGESTAGTA